MNEGYAKCGEVFTVPVLHKNITFLIGPHVSPHFFKANDDQLSQEEARFLSSASSCAHAATGASTPGWLTAVSNALMRICRNDLSLQMRLPQQLLSCCHITA